jgi:large subunit ribosomal protein L36e
MVRGLIREISGWSPYEKRLMEILKGGGNNPTKRAWKYAKNRLGTHIRAKRKVKDMEAVIQEIKRQEAQAKAAAAKKA